MIEKLEKRILSHSQYQLETVNKYDEREFGDKINELIEQSNRQDDAIKLIAKCFGGDHWQRIITNALSGNKDYL